MRKFEILCVTMNQIDFAKIHEMNVNSDIIFSNQDTRNDYSELRFDSKHTARMVTTNTRGVGVSRNIALAYSSGDICLLADDDMYYFSDVEDIVLSEFEKHPKYDVIVFNIENDSKERPEFIIRKGHKLHRFSRKPFGAVRIAFRRNAILKKSIYFNTLFGGGCIYQAGEDSLFLKSIFKSNLKVFASEKFIGKTSTKESTWFKGYNEAYFYSKGAFIAASQKKPFLLWALYYYFRTRNNTDLSLNTVLKYMKYGKKGFNDTLSFEEFNNTFGGS